MRYFNTINVVTIEFPNTTFYIIRYNNNMTPEDPLETYHRIMDDHNRTIPFGASSSLNSAIDTAMDKAVNRTIPLQNLRIITPAIRGGFEVVRATSPLNFPNETVTFPTPDVVLEPEEFGNRKEKRAWHKSIWDEYEKFRDLGYSKVDFLRVSGIFGSTHEKTIIHSILTREGIKRKGSIKRNSEHIPEGINWEMTRQDFLSENAYRKWKTGTYNKVVNHMINSKCSLDDTIRYLGLANTHTEQLIRKSTTVRNKLKLIEEAKIFTRDPKVFGNAAFFKYQEVIKVMPHISDPGRLRLVLKIIQEAKNAGAERQAAWFEESFVPKVKMNDVKPDRNIPEVEVEASPEGISSRARKSLVFISNEKYYTENKKTQLALATFCFLLGAVTIISYMQAPYFLELFKSVFNR